MHLWSGNPQAPHRERLACLWRGVRPTARPLWGRVRGQESGPTFCFPLGNQSLPRAKEAGVGGVWEALVLAVLLQKSLRPELYPGLCHPEPLWGEGPAD